MRELTEQENISRLQAIDNFINSKDRKLYIGERQAFSAGFKAGLKCQLEKIERLQKALEKLGETL